MMSKFLSLVFMLLFSTPFQAQALLFNQPLDFVATSQSLWGPDGETTDFGGSGSKSLGPVDFSYSIGASTGTVSARFPGDLSVAYSPSLSAPGTTSLNLSFLGDTDNGQLKSDLGAWVNVGALCYDVLKKGYALNIENNDYTPQIGQQVFGSDSTTVGNSGIDVLVAEAGADFDIEQTDLFKATTVNGLVVYSLRGSDATSFMPFSLGTDAGLTLDLELGDLGIWDFSLVDVMLENEFSTSFDAELVLYEEHISGVEICGEFPYYYPCFSYDRNEVTLADIDVYDGSPFQLNFAPISNTSGFSIYVETTPVPEPTTMLLFGTGLVVLTGLSRRRRN